MLIKLADGKIIEPGRKKRNYVDADGTLYTVWVKWVAGQCIYRPHWKPWIVFAICLKKDFFSDKRERGEEGWKDKKSSGSWNCWME